RPRQNAALDQLVYGAFRTIELLGQRAARNICRRLSHAITYQHRRKGGPEPDHPGTGSGPPPHVRAVELKFAGDPDGLITNVAVRARSVRLTIEEISTDYLPEASYRRSPQDSNCRVITGVTSDHASPPRSQSQPASRGREAYRNCILVCRSFPHRPTAC